jgi:hypothetical protein
MNGRRSAMQVREMPVATDIPPRWDFSSAKKPAMTELRRLC